MTYMISELVKAIRIIGNSTCSICFMKLMLYLYNRQNNKVNTGQQYWIGPAEHLEKMQLSIVSGSEKKSVTSVFE